jgi:hypothetical protein
VVYSGIAVVRLDFDCRGIVGKVGGFEDRRY